MSLCAIRLSQCFTDTRKCRAFSKWFPVFVLICPAILFADESSIESKVSRTDLDAKVIEATIADHAIVGFSWIDQPLNRIVLIRTKRDLCAIRYLSFSRGHDSKNETAFTSGDESLFAEAEFYSKAKGTVIHLHLSHRPTSGFGKLILLNRSKSYIVCGKKRLLWEYPTATSLLSADPDVSLTSTQLSAFDKIRFDDPTLRWFQYEEGRRILFQ